MNAVLAIAMKDLTLLWRDKFALFWVFAFPLMFALFFGSIFGGSGDGASGSMSVVVVDEDGSEGSAALIEKLDANDGIEVPRAELAEGETGEAPYLDLEIEAAREAVQKGRHVAYVRIPEGYGLNPFALFGAGDEESPSLEIGIDPRRQAEAGMLQGILMEAIFTNLQSQFLDTEFMQGEIAQIREDVAQADDIDDEQKGILENFLGSLDTFIGEFEGEAAAADAAGDGEEAGGGFDLGALVEVVEVARERGNRPRSMFEISFPQALVWGLMSVAMTFAITLVRERTSGTLLRLRMAPITGSQLLAGKGLACFLACLGTMSVLMGFAVIALGVRFDSVPLFLLAMLCTAACFTGIMMLVSVLGKTENAVAGSSWGLMMPFAMIGGGMIPLIAMPGWLSVASNFSPFKWAITAVEGGLWRGFDLSDMLLPCVILLAIGVVAFAAGAVIFRRTAS